MSTNPEDFLSILFGGSGSGGNAKVEPSADARKAAGAAFEMYSAFVNQGFSEDQAMNLLMSLIVAQAKGGS